MSEIREKATLSGGRYKQNQKFEEMRRLQDTLAQEKKEWNIKKQSLEAEEKEMKAKMAKDQVILILKFREIATLINFQKINSMLQFHEKSLEAEEKK